MFRWIVLIACLLAAAAGLAVGVMNPDPVPVRLPGLEVQLALGSLLVIVFVLGVLAGTLLFLLFFHLPSRLLNRGRKPIPNGSRLPNRNA